MRNRNTYWGLSASALSIAAISVCPAFAADNYDVTFEGAPIALQEKLPLVSRLAQKKQPYPTTASIRRAGRNDIEAVKAALSAAGYYTASVEFSLAKSDNDAAPSIATFKITPGPLFEISDHRIVYTDSGDGDRPGTFSDMEIDASNNADGASIQQNQKAFLSALQNGGFPSARIVQRYVDANLDAGTARAVYEFESGPRAIFGDLIVEGNDRTKISFLAKLKTWEDNSEFDKEKLVSYRDDLSATGIFNSIDVAPGAPAEDGRAPVFVTVGERKRRTIGAGVSFSTTEGPGGRLFFEYRNLFGAGESARATIEATEIQQSVQFDFNKPMPKFPGSLFASFGFSNETTDAFNARTIALSGGASKRWFDDRLETIGGVGFEISDVEQNNVKERTYFFSLPLTAIWDTEIDPLKLEHGARASFNITPFTGTDTFTRAEFNGRSRIHFGGRQRFTLAGRARLGSLFGSSLDDLPINQRFFSGGGASVRGFDFQSVGNLDANSNPIGGRSVIEAAIEARAKIMSNIQLAAFIDTGSVSDTSLPNFAGNYFTGIGGGIRYVTPIGPIRADVAIPLERRDSDRAVQVFLSLGQPF